MPNHFHLMISVNHIEVVISEQVIPVESEGLTSSHCVLITTLKKPLSSSGKRLLVFLLVSG
jgi:hypothetical protein